MAYILTKEALEDLFSSSGLDKYGMLEACVDPSERVLRRLFWREDMENYSVVKWIPNDPSDTVISYTNTAPVRGAFEGDYVLSVHHATNRHCETRVNFGCFRLQKTGFEMRWFKRPGTKYGGYVGNVRCEDVAAAALKAMVRWTTERDDGEEGWEYRDSNSNVIDVPGGKENILNNTWNYVKMIIDWENGTFDRLTTNLLDIDLSGIALETISTGIGQFRILLGFDVLDSVTLPYPSYVDDTRLYLNEV